MISQSIMDYESMCRLCLRKDNNMLHVFSRSSLESAVPAKIEKYLHLNIKNADSFSKLVCIRCVKKIEDTHTFFIEVEQNQQKLFHLQTVPEYELIFEEEDVTEEDQGTEENITKQYIGIKSSSVTHELNFTSTSLVENSKQYHEYEIMFIQAPNDTATVSSVLVDEENVNDINRFDAVSVLSSNDDGEVMEDDSNSKDEFCYSTEGFPKVLIQDAKLVVRGRELFQLMSRFYKLQCEICEEKDSVFVKLTQLLEHYEDIHSTKGFVKCCGVKLNKTRTMALHMARHVQPDAFKCPECDKMMTCPRILRYHIQNHLPEDERPLACPECPRRFSYSSALIAHSSIHLPEEERDYHVCDECGKSFLTASRLAAHVSATHSKDVRRFVCHECGKQFSCRGNLTYHLTTHEQIHQVQCTVCQKWLKNKLCLRKHMTQHSEKRHQCLECDYSSLNSQAFRNHLRVQHSNDKPHVCQECGRTFKLKNTLLNHIVQHTGERKYSCEFCSKRFASSGNYYSHRKRMHPNELAEHNQKRAEEKEIARKIALQQIVSK